MIDAAAVQPRGIELSRELSRRDSFTDHLDRYGPMPSGDPSLIDVIDASGLRGRGGAAFPAGTKWRAVADRSAGRSVVLVNGVEADPSSRKDHALLMQRPHLAIDGAILAARAIGGAEIVVAVNRRAPAVYQAVAAAMAERQERIPMQLVAVPSRYVAGEETALVHFLNGGDARPTLRPPRPFERGVRGRPTLVHNPETLAWAALVARHGDHWFRTLGSATHPGAVLVTVLGAVAHPGVYELSAVATADDALRLAGARGGQALLLGGYFGDWSASYSPDAPADARTLDDVRAGVILVLPADACGLTETARIMSFLAEESAHQCGPCFNGLPALASTMAWVATGHAQHADVARLHHWVDQLGGGRGACHHPDGAITLLRSALHTFEADLRDHVLVGPCPGSRMVSILPSAPAEQGWR